MSNKAKKWQEGEYVIRVTGNHITATKFIQEQKNFMNTTLDVTKAYKGIAACDPQDEFDLSEGVKMAMNRLNLLLNDKFSNEIKVGDTVKIINFGKFYTTYCDWVDKYVTSGYDKCRYAFKQTPNNNIGKVLYMAKHGAQNTMLAFIEVKTAEGYTDPCYLISVEGAKEAMKQSWNGWSYPKMMPEIIEAVETHFCDNKDIIVDCMLYLKNATARVEDLNTVNKWFDDNNRCHVCGCELETVTTKEPHFELGPDVYENLVDYYCPNCAGFIDERR